MVRIRQQREVLSSFVGKLIAQVLGFVVRINTNGEDFDLRVWYFFE
jgi:hypothetical protein